MVMISQVSNFISKYWTPNYRLREDRPINFVVSSRIWTKRGNLGYPYPRGESTSNFN